MRLSRRTNIIILWITSIGLLVGMVITFTPTLGALTGTAGETSAPALIVNGETIRDLQVAQVRQSSPVYSTVNDGPVAEDLDLLLFDTLLRNEVVRQAAARQRVGNGEVRTAVNDFRVANGVDGSRNDQAYLRLIGGAGYDDATFRTYVRGQLQIQKYQQEVTAGVAVSEEEVRAFYETNLDSYQTDARVVARQIVVSDADLAASVRERALAGEAFADLAREVSLERSEVGGAVGGDEPQPVGRPAFPTNVATAVFSRSTPGLTPVVQAADGFYVVSVEQVVASEPRPFDEVRAEVEANALAAKQQAALDEALEVLLDEAVVTVPEGSILTAEDEVVAVVGGEEIMASDLVRATYNNPQIQQALSPQTATLILDFFKPSILEQLVDGELAVQGSELLDATFFGTDDLVAQSALEFVAREANADETEVEAYYEANLDRYTVPATAEVLRVDFPELLDAGAYRVDLLAGADPLEAAEAAGFSAVDLGVVRRGDLRRELDISLFETDAYAPLPNSVREISDVLVLEPDQLEAPEVVGADVVEDVSEEAADAAAEAADPVLPPEATYTVLVAVRTPDEVLPLDEVRSDVEEMVLANERQELQRDWLEGLRETIEVEVRLGSALEDESSVVVTADEVSEEEGDGELAVEESSEGESPAEAE